jgi:hypothetical protein
MQISLDVRIQGVLLGNRLMLFDTGAAIGRLMIRKMPFVLCICHQAALGQFLPVGELESSRSATVSDVSPVTNTILPYSARCANGSNGRERDACCKLFCRLLHVPSRQFVVLLNQLVRCCYPERFAACRLDQLLMLRFKPCLSALEFRPCFRD